MDRNFESFYYHRDTKTTSSSTWWKLAEDARGLRLHISKDIVVSGNHALDESESEILHPVGNSVYNRALVSFVEMKKVCPQCR